MHQGQLIINLAPTGMVPMREQNPTVPLTPEQIAEDCGRCRESGASILHLHARDADGAPTYRRDLYREIIVRVRARCPDAIICVSTSGRNFKTFEQRSDVLDLEGDAKPEMASLTPGSMNFPQQASVNEPSMIRMLADPECSAAAGRSAAIGSLNHRRRFRYRGCSQTSRSAR